MLRRSATRCSPSAADSSHRSAGRASSFRVLGVPSRPASAVRCRDPLLDAFDAPDATGTTSRRDTTTTSTQALLLINGGWTLARARALADRLVHFEPASIGDRARIVLAYRLTLGRGPDPEEIAEARMFLDRQARMSRLPSFRSGRDDRSALVDFCHVLLNSNAFLYID